ncbi:MAG: glycosyltransferase family 2 protein, partial [bacterium]
TRWLFDVELLMRIITERGKEETLKAVFEIPLNGWQDKKGSKVTFLQFLRTPWEIFKIFRRYSA